MNRAVWRTPVSTPRLVGGHRDGQAQHHPVGDAADDGGLVDLDAGQAGLDHLAQQAGHDRAHPQDDQGNAQAGQEPSTWAGMSDSRWGASRQ